MNENFSKAFDFLIELEGYESNDALDAGGFTRYGIAQKYHPEVDVSKLTKEQAKEIYLKDYWKAAGCDELPYPLDIVVFIQGVNVGVGTIRRMLLDSRNDVENLLWLNAERYVSRPRLSRDRFLAGWINRLIKLRRFIWA